MTAKANARQSYKKLRYKLPKNTETIARYLLTVILIILSVFVIWFNRVYTDPAHVFWGMIANNLSTPGVTRELIQKNGTIQTDSLTRLWFNPGPVVRSLRQISNSSGGTSAKITLESIANNSDVYQRYSLIDQPGSLGQKKPDFSSLYDLWLKDGGTNTNNQQVFNSGLFGFLFFGNFNPTQKIALINYIKDKKLYSVDYQHISRSKTNHRNYTYSVVLNPRSYVDVARFYAKLLGLPKNSWIESGAVASNLSVRANVSVDVLSRQSTKITYIGKNTTETVKAFGLNSPITLPTHVVSLSNYQNVLNSVNQ